MFISNGNIARYIWVGAVTDRKKPVQTSVSFVVRNDAKGFSLGSIEKKMGQRACPAAELIFEDVFVPDEDRVGDEGEGEKLIATVLGASRGPVAAITGDHGGDRGVTVVCRVTGLTASSCLLHPSSGGAGAGP